MWPALFLTSNHSHIRQLQFATQAFSQKVLQQAVQISICQWLISAFADAKSTPPVPNTELYYSLEERLGMKKCRQKHGGFWALLTPLGTYGYRYLPLTNRDAILLTKSFTPLVFAKKFMAFLFSGQSLREKSFLFRLWT